MYGTIFGFDPVEYHNLVDKSNFFIVTFFAHTLLIFTMIMNLLISIISNTYEKMQNIEKSNDMKMKVELMEEIEVLLFGRRDWGQQEYLHVIKYSDAENVGNIDQWEGKIRTITSKTESILDQFKLGQR